MELQSTFACGLVGQRLGQVMWPGGLYNTNMLDADWQTESFYTRAQWRLCWVMWPCRCALSNRWIWPGQQAYLGRAIWMGPGEDAVEDRWHTCQEHLIWNLKK